MLVVIPGSTAFRYSDWSKLTWSDILGQKQLVVKNEKKTGKRRSVAIADQVQEMAAFAFEKIKSQTAPSHHAGMMKRPIFSGLRHNQALSNAGVKHALEALAKAADVPLPVSSHSLRKAWGIRMFELQGADFRALLAVQKWFGHASFETTLCYLGFEDQRRDDMVNKLWA